MTNQTHQPWLNWAKQLQAIAQTGEAYSKDPYDLERFEQIAQISHQMFAHLSDQPLENVQRLFLPEKGYPTPKVDLRAGVIKDNQILLVRERSDGRWTLPGGWADVCETPSAGILREVAEESGYTVHSPRLVAIKDRSVHPYRPVMPIHVYKFFYLCTFAGGTPITSNEISEVRFFSLDQLPELSIGRVLPEDIKLMFQYHADPNLPVYTD